MSEAENLGPADTWAIRSVPQAIKQAILDKAHSERVPVGEIITRMVLGGEGPLPAQPQIDADRLLTLLQCAALADKGEGLHAATKAAVKVAVGHEIRGIRRAQKKLLALPAPSSPK